MSALTRTIALCAATDAVVHLTTLHPELRHELAEIGAWIARAFSRDPMARSVALPDEHTDSVSAWAYLDAQLSLASHVGEEVRAICEAQHWSDRAQRRLRQMPPGGYAHAEQTAASAVPARPETSSEFAGAWPLKRPRRSCRCLRGTCRRCLARVLGTST